MERVKYTRAEFQEAYEAWAYSMPGTLDKPLSRILQWDNYCDVRDGLPKGTSTARRLRKTHRLQLVH